ncbi:hypothetical protein BJ741DRAFT_619531 [Chytriomyces cf. hyalinus JEL632]|nr:hypothetical protein BJ741DRAFT_619531 [Chytriomyces cf. hyalinus JEL632]
MPKHNEHRGRSTFPLQTASSPRVYCRGRSRNRNQFRSPGEPTQLKQSMRHRNRDGNRYCSPAALVASVCFALGIFGSRVKRMLHSLSFPLQTASSPRVYCRGRSRNRNQFRSPGEPTQLKQSMRHRNRDGNRCCSPAGLVGSRCFVFGLRK